MAAMQAMSKVADSILGKKDVSQTATRPKESETETMKAVVYLAPKKVGVEDKPKPLLTDPHDVIIKVRYHSKTSSCSQQHALDAVLGEPPPCSVDLDQTSSWVDLMLCTGACRSRLAPSAQAVMAISMLEKFLQCVRIVSLATKAWASSKAKETR